MAMPDMPKEAWAQLEEYPLSAPPPGIMANFQHRVWHGESVVIAGAIGIPAMFIMSAIRMYRKCYARRRWDFDDLFLLSLSCGFSLAVLQISLMTGGAYGYHAWDVQIKDLTKPVLVRSLVLTVANPLLTWGIKLAVYSLIFAAFRPLTYTRRMVYAGVGVSFTLSVTADIVNAIVCGPKGGTDRLAYLAGMAGPQCGNPSGLIQISSTFSGVANLVNDLYLLFLPLPACYKLNMPLKRRLGVMLIFLGGTRAFVMSILALIYRQRSFSYDANSMWARDTTYIQIPLWIVTTVEYSVGVIITCMAPFVKFSKHMATATRSYLNTRLFQRTSSTGEDYKSKRVASDGVKKEPESQTDTTDRMLAQMFPGDSASHAPKDKENITVDTAFSVTESRSL